MIDLDSTNKKFLRPDEFCEIFRLPRSTFYKYCYEGVISPIQKGRGFRIIISIEEARRYRDEEFNNK